MSDGPVKSRCWLSSLDKFLTYDFCPGANRWVYWMKHPLAGMAVAAVAAGLCGFYVAAQAWLLCVGLLLIVVLGLFWPVLALAGLRVSLRFEQAWCEEGQPVLVRVRVANRLPCSVWGFSLTGGMPGEALLVSFTRIAGWKETEFLWKFVPNQRGVYPSQPVYVETGFPFGVWTARKIACAEGEIVILPKPVKLDSVPGINSASSFDEIFTDRKTGESGDVTGTRPFREGDCLRRVHWSLTARTSRLICCERQAVRHSSVVVAIDLENQHHSAFGADSSLEWAIRIFAGICQELTKQGVSVTAVIGSDSIRVQPGHEGLLRLMIRLARLPAQGLSTKTGNAIRDVISDIRVMTDRSEPSDSAIQVLLETQSFESQKAESEFIHPLPKLCPSSTNLRDSYSLNTQRIHVERSADIPQNFRHNWRRACHAIS